MREETDTHIFNHCRAYNHQREKVWKRVCDTLSYFTEVDLLTIPTQVTNWFIPNNDANSSGSELWFLGGIPLKVKVWIIKYLKRNDQLMLWQRIHKIVMELVKEIWERRCDLNCKKGWSFHDLHLEFIEDAIILENNLLECAPEDIWDNNSL